MPKPRRKCTSYVGGAEWESTETVTLAPRIDAYEKYRLQRAIKRDPSTNCWIWGEHLDIYSTVMWRGRKILAHRLMLELSRGAPVDPGNHVHHKCRTPACVNPAHLVEVTPEQHKAIHAKLPRQSSRVTRRVG